MRECVKSIQSSYLMIKQRITLYALRVIAHLLCSSATDAAPPSLSAPVDHSTCIRHSPSNDAFLFCRRTLASSDKSEASFTPLCHEPQPNVTERHLPKIDHKRLRYQLTKLSLGALCILLGVRCLPIRAHYYIVSLSAFPQAKTSWLPTRYDHHHRLKAAYGKFVLALILDRNRLWAQLPLRKKLSHHF